MKYLLKTFMLVLIPVLLNAQNKTVDSLRSVLNNSTNDSVKVTILLAIGQEFLFGGLQMDSTYDYIQRALLLSRETGNVDLEIKANGAIANLFFRSGNYPEALKLSLENLKNAEAIKDSNSIFFARRELMWIYIAIGDEVKAMEVARYLISLVQFKFFKKSEMNSFYQFVPYHNLANIFQDLKKFDSALYYRKLIYAQVRSQNNNEGLALSAGSLGQLYALMDKPDSARYYTNLGIYYATISRRFDLVRDGRLDIASLLLKEGRLDSSLYYSQLIFNQSKDISDTAGMMRAAELLSQGYGSTKRFDSAYAYLTLFLDLKDKSLIEEKVQQTRRISFNDQLHNKELEQERTQARQQFASRVKIYILIAVLAAMLIIAFILYRNNRRKQRDKTRIEKAYVDLKAMQQQLIQAEKMASLGELTAGIAHEIQNPLNFVNNFSEVNQELVDELKHELETGNAANAIAIAHDIKENEEKILQHGRRADGIVKSMLQHSRSSSGIKEPTDINELADEYLRLAYHGLRAKDKSFHAKFETDFDNAVGKIRVVPQDIGRVVLNLISNAFYSVNEKQAQGIQGYEPTVTVRTKKLPGKVEIRIMDNGKGIPQKVFDKIFQPFFTTKPTGEGTGLGLSLSYDIVTKGHGGQLKAETKEGEGATFIILLPDNQ